MAKYIHNISGGTEYYLGVEVADDAFYLIPTSRETDYANNNALLTKLAAGDAKMSADGSTDIAGDAGEQIKFLVGEQVVRPRAFADDEGVVFNGQGFSGTATNSTTTNIDYKIVGDHRFNGIHVYLNNHVLGDTVTLSIVDKDNVLGLGAGVVLNTFATNWIINGENSRQREVMLPYYAKIVNGLYVRVAYTSTGVSDVDVCANLYLHKES